MSLNQIGRILILCCGTALAATAQALEYTEQRQPCADRNPLRNAYFGDLHVHTARSFDAVSAGTRATPADAYDFARGRPIGIPPFAADGTPLRTVQIDQPLDFMAVTDHAEFFGETRICAGGELPGPVAAACGQDQKQGSRQAFPMLITHREPQRIAALCGDDGERCANAAKPAWLEMQEAAEQAYDRSAECAFTSFVGYEYSATPGGSNLHRNIIFRNDQVPAQPLSYIDAPQPADLWRGLEKRCNNAVTGCEFVSIPHNSNLSNGRMFPPLPTEQKAAAELARLRIESEPIVEMIQHKGSSECANGLSAILGEPDELCDFEQVRRVGGGNELDMKQLAAIFGVDQMPPPSDCEDPATPAVRAFGTANQGCISANDFVRGALLLGLAEQERVGVNPYRFGLIGSTDTHLGTGGNVREQSWNGHLGYETTLKGRLALGFMPSNRLGNPGGLAGVWAEENSRDAIFDAIRRREVFATSGPRILPRLFASSRFEPSLCANPDRIATAYAQGIPMGGTVPGLEPGATLRLLALAVRDNAEWAVPLQHLQVIKGWLGPEGERRYRVFDVATAGDKGAAELCAVFEDPEFTADQPAYYYLRVVEQPTLRWDSAQCIEAGEKAPASCAGVGEKLIREMAWTSPLWYEP